jgi:uncharacterized FlgJ-related protein
MTTYSYDSENLTFTEVEKKISVMYSFLALSLLFILFSLVYSKGISDGIAKSLAALSESEKEVIVISEYERLNAFTEERFLKFVSKTKVKYPDVVFCQAVIESNNFTSAIFVENNNMFGMKEAKTRPTLSTGTNRNHATFDTWQDCVLDYVIWQSRYASHIKTKEDYIVFLDKIYAEDSSYGDKIRKMLKIRYAALK